MMDTPLYLFLPLLLIMGAALALTWRRYRLSELSSGENREAGRLGALLERYAALTGTSLTAHELLIVWTCAVTVALFAGLILGNGPASVALLGVCGLASVPVWAIIASRSRRRRFEEQLGETLPLIASTMRSGSSLGSAIATAATFSPEPLRGELQRFSRERASGASMAEALHHMADRTASRDLSLFATAVDLSQQTGGSLADITDRVAETIRSRAELRAFARSRTSMNRTSAKLIAALPFAFAIGFSLFDSSAMDFYTSPTGIVVIFAAFACDMVGYALMSV
ncbi:MAG: type II secretion system F family protein, partial [Collinsella sp.]|nr:type II secretion system F family protein [Collinsella sp.]